MPYKPCGRKALGMENDLHFFRYGDADGRSGTVTVDLNIRDIAFRTVYKKDRTPVPDVVFYYTSNYQPLLIFGQEIIKRAITIFALNPRGSRDFL